jgi:hypothetical protein
MVRPYIYRNDSASDQLDIFLLAAVTSLLLLRFFLYLAGYPQVGGGSLHIAHMLWGGLLMVAALTLAMSFIGSRVLKLVALLGGAGFGIFIDEIGKFITKDNNYFFRPAIGIIYAIFTVMYLTFNFLTRQQRLTQQEYAMNALLQMEEVVAGDLDKLERSKLLNLLRHADQASPLVQQLQAVVKSVPTIGQLRPSLQRRLRDWLDKHYRHFWQRDGSRGFVQFLFVAVVFLFISGSYVVLEHNYQNLLDLAHGTVSYGQVLLVGQLASSVIAVGFALNGIANLGRSRLAAFEQFRRAALINIYLTQFFTFLREQFGAIPGFIFNLVLLLIISYVMYQERRFKRESV